MGLAAGKASPIIMRHDVFEAHFLELSSQFPPVVSARPAEARRGLGGEGTLIDPSWILTAAHVAAELRPGDLAEVSGVVARIDHIVLHPEWHRVTDVKWEVALLHLAEPIRQVSPAALYTWSNEAGLEVTFVGRGGTGTGLTGEEDRRLRAATNRVEKAEGPFLHFRFDAPEDSAATAPEGISGPSDSGGAAFLLLDDKLFVFGVSFWQDSWPTGRQQGRYGVVEHYTRVSCFRDWVRKELSPLGEGGPHPSPCSSSAGGHPTPPKANP